MVILGPGPNVAEVQTIISLHPHAQFKAVDQDTWSRYVLQDAIQQGTLPSTLSIYDHVLDIPDEDAHVVYNLFPSPRGANIFASTITRVLQHNGKAFIITELPERADLYTERLKRDGLFVIQKPIDRKDLIVNSPYAEDTNYLILAYKP